MHKLAALLVALPLLAGCLTPPSDPAKQAAQALANESAIYDAVEAKVGAPLTEDGVAPGAPPHVNLLPLATVTGTEGRAPQPTEGYVESAVKGGYAYLCRTGPDEGLVIFDIHDIAHPRQVGYVKLDAGFEPDIEVSDDGHWAFWETQRAGGSVAAPDPADPAGQLPRGIHVIDISDKAHPKWVGFTPVAPDGPHSITYARIGGQDYLFASIYSWQYVGTSVTPVQLAPPMTQRETIFKLDASLPVVQLKEVATYIDPDAAEPNPAMPVGGRMPHDVSISVHPVTGRTYAYIAYWDLGVVILDVTDPAHPVKAGQATDFGIAPTREIHMARQSNGTIDGKVVLVTEPEIGGQPTTGYMSALDITDPAHPAVLSNWKIPGNATSAGGGRGPHYFDFQAGRVVMASYAAGFWVYDIHDHQNLLRPRTTAYSLVQPSAGGTSLPGPLAGLGGGSAFDAWWVDPTHVIGVETGNGLVTFEYQGPAPAVDAPAA
jgi:hypothetical protein